MSPRSWRTAAESTLLAAIVGHILLCPYTKVEESFSLQAIHDILVHRDDLGSYDHHDFPGVVPRTFLGPMLISAFSAPVHSVLEAFGDFETRHSSQLVARLTLGFLCWTAFRRFNAAAAAVFGDAAAGWSAMLWTLQFHLPFYLSRTLPNVFALCLVLLGLSEWLRGKLPRALGWLTVATVVCRCDVVVLLAPLTLQLLLSRQIGPLRVVAVGMTWGLISLVFTVAVDSVMWGRWLWPEGQVLFFNTVDNRSSEWGKMPWHWYFTSALPRALSGAALLVPVGLLRDPTRPLETFRRPSVGVDTTMLSYLLPGLSMICLYSILPHKELRFIFPALPLLNLAGGLGMSRAVGGVSGGAPRVGESDDGGGDKNRRIGLMMRMVLLATILGSFAAMAGSTVLATLASRDNYPGGVALDVLHSAIDNESATNGRDALVHIGPDAAMSGVSRFGQRKTGVSYSKQEREVDWSKFDFIIAAEPSDHLQLFETREAIEGFNALNFARFWQPDYQGGWGGIVTVSKTEKLYVMTRWFPPPPREDLI